MSNKTVTAVLVGIFNIVMFICGTVLCALNFFNGVLFEPFIAYIALAMWIVPTIYFTVILIKSKNK